MGVLENKLATGQVKKWGRVADDRKGLKKNPYSLSFRMQYFLPFDLLKTFLLRISCSLTLSLWINCGDVC